MYARSHARLKRGRTMVKIVTLAVRRTVKARVAFGLGVLSILVLLSALLATLNSPMPKRCAEKTALDASIVRLCATRAALYDSTPRLKADEAIVGGNMSTQCANAVAPEGSVVILDDSRTDITRAIDSYYGLKKDERDIDDRITDLEGGLGALIQSRARTSLNTLMGPNQRITFWDRLALWHELGAKAFSMSDLDIVLKCPA